MFPSEWSGTAWEGEPVQARTVVDDSVVDLLRRYTGTTRVAPYRFPTVREALGVPSIQRCVTLISNTTGSLTVRAYRNAAVMAETPPLVARPDPWRRPGAFYRDTAFNMATRGEFVWYIANFDSDGRAAALVVVPLAELSVEETNDRLRPTYRWGDIESTRWSPVNPRGRFVHETYLQEPGSLRGMGPLQMGGAAVSVAVEAQEWAANFYAEGGYPSLVIKHATELDPNPDADGYNEADRLRNQFMEKAHNVPRVIDQNIESIEPMTIDTASAQALQSRDYSNGDAARLFGMPGALLEYGVEGASLTYQNLADVWLSFVRGCLAVNYLEVIEQALSDLLSRSTVARFLTSGLYRADAKTRWEIYQIAVDVLGQEEAADMARVGEDLAPGNPEVAPVPYAPPAAIPSSLPKVRTLAPERVEVRCDGTRVRRIMGQPQMVPCGKLLSETGVFVGRCPRCDKDHTAVA